MAAEFVILNLGSDPTRIGGSYTILGVADTQAAAQTILESLPASAATRVAILEKKELIRRVPAVRLEPLTEDIIP